MGYVRQTEEISSSKQYKQVQAHRKEEKKKKKLKEK